MKAYCPIRILLHKIISRFYIVRILISIVFVKSTRVRHHIYYDGIELYGTVFIQHKFCVYKNCRVC